jgi:type IV pilus assembly protein PilW
MNVNQSQKTMFIKCHGGYSMLELLVAMTLGILVLSSAVTMQVSNRDGFKSTTAQLHMKTNAKLATEFMGRSLRGVGAIGCRTGEGFLGGDGENSDTSAYIVALNDTTLPRANFNPGHEVLGYQGNDTGWETSSTPDASLNLTNILVGSDAITLRGTIGEAYVLAPRTDGDAAYFLDIPAGTDVRIAQNNYAVASTCSAAEVFHVTSTNVQIDLGIVGRAAGAGTDDNNTGTYDSENSIEAEVFGELMRMATVTYYVGQNPAGIPTLYRNIDGVSSPLIEGVERMKLDYGVEDDENGARNVASMYLSASQIQATCSDPMTVPVSAGCLWPDVVSVRVSLIMRSKETVFGKNIVKTYTLPGTDQLDLDANDQFARSIYSTTFTLRNRAIGDRTNNG